MFTGITKSKLSSSQGLFMLGVAFNPLVWVLLTHRDKEAYVADWYVFPEGGTWKLQADGVVLGRGSFKIVLDQGRESALHGWQKRREPGTVRVWDVTSRAWSTVASYG
jgi:hypothetical protein